ncbi:unnamed protein product, partial [marine sediment metagenome]
NTRQKKFEFYYFNQKFPVFHPDTTSQAKS